MSSPTIPFRIDAFNVYRIENSREAFVGIASIDLPEITYKTETISGSGFGGDFDAPSTNIEAMELVLNFSSPTEEVSKLLAPGAHRLVIRAAETVQDRVTGMISQVPLRWDATGMTASGGGGSLESSTAVEASVTLNLIEFGKFRNNKEEYYFNITGNILRVKGVDYKAKIRSMI